MEARHQTFIRVASKQAAAPQAFDTPLGPKMVFSLAAPFITSCPTGSNLILTAFPKLTMTAPPAGTAVTIGQTITLTADNSTTGATNCGFTNGGLLPGGTVFTPFTPGGGCVVPQNLAGVTYLTLTSSAPNTGVISDDIIVAGVIRIIIS